jgi:hypothetical protein
MLQAKSFYPDKYGYVLGGILIATFLFISFPGNRIEADDAYRYAFNITRKDFSEIYHGRYLLFQPMFKVLYDAFHRVIPTIDGYTFICCLSVIFSTTTIINCYRILRECFKTDKSTALLTCAFILFSYGFWRYSVEVEVYAIANMLISFVFLFVLKSVQTNEVDNKFMLLAAVLTGISILIYKPSFIPLALSIPLLYLFKKKYTSFVLFEAIAGIISLTGYYLAYLGASTHNGNFMAFVKGGGTQSGGNLLLGPFVFIGDIVSTNFAFGINRLVGLIQKSFAYGSIAEEIYAAKTNGIFNYIAIFTLLLVSLGFLYFFIKVLFSRQKGKFTQVHFILVVWFFLYTLIIIYLDPNSPEPYVMAILPFWLFVGPVCIPVYKQTKPAVPVFWLLIILFVHNVIGGYKIYHSKKSSLVVLKSTPILNLVRPGDIILAAGQFSGIIWYLRYNTEVDVLWVEEEFNVWEPRLTNALASGHHLYFIPDEPKALKVKKKNVLSQQIKHFAQRNSLQMVTIEEKKFKAGGLMELKPL